MCVYIYILFTIYTYIYTHISYNIYIYIYKHPHTYIHTYVAARVASAQRSGETVAGLQVLNNNIIYSMYHIRYDILYTACYILYTI